MNLRLEVMDIMRKFVDEGTVKETQVCEEIVANDDMFLDTEGFNDGLELDSGCFQVVGVFGVLYAKSWVKTRQITTC